MDDVIDDKEFEGDIISQLNSSHEFVKTNSKVRWKKAATRRIDKPDFTPRLRYAIEKMPQDKRKLAMSKG